MSKQQALLGRKEFIAIAFFLIVIKATDDIPALLFDSLFTAGWMGPVISGFLALIPLYLLIDIARKTKETSAITIFYSAFGKYIGFFVLFCLWIIGFIYITLDTAIYADIISTMYFVKTPTFVLYAILLGVAAYGAKKGLEQIGAVSWALLPLLQVILLFSFILMIVHGKTEFLYPILGPGMWELIRESSMSMSIYVDFFYLFLLFPFVKSKKDYTFGTSIAFIIIALNLTIAMASFLMLFDFSSVQFLNYPYHEAIRTISIGFITNIETMIFPFWLIASDLKFVIYLYINVFLFGQIFKITEFEYIIPAFATLMLFLGLVPESPTFSILEMTRVIGYVLSPIFFLLPIILWITIKSKGGLKNESK